MATAKVRSLRVRPIQSTDLAFNMAGILDYHNQDLAVLGARIANGYDLAALYTKLGEFDSTTGLITYDAEKIRKSLVDEAKVVLFSVRNAALRTGLAQAIAQRQNVYLRRYKHSADIIVEYERLYPTNGTPGLSSKLGRIAALLDRDDHRHDDLETAYDSGGIGVITETVTETKGDSANQGASTTTAKSDTIGTSTSVTTTTSDAKTTEESRGLQTSTSSMDTKIVPLAYVNGGHSSAGKIEATQVTTQFEGNTATVAQRIEAEDSLNVPAKWNGTNWEQLEVSDPDFSSQVANSSAETKVSNNGSTISTSTSVARGLGDSKTTGTSKSFTDNNGTGKFEQNARTQLTEYRHPRAENDVRWHRRHLDMQDERLAHTLNSYQVKHLSVILANELRQVDADVLQLQLHFTHTHLISPIAGIVTAVYKDLGESVQPGEPVLRVENDETILLVGVINYRGRVKLNAKVSITVPNVFEDGVNAELEGTVVAVRGHDSDNDEWDLILRCGNRKAGEPILPLNYSLDYRDKPTILFS